MVIYKFLNIQSIQMTFRSHSFCGINEEQSENSFERRYSNDSEHH